MHQAKLVKICETVKILLDEAPTGIIDLNSAAETSIVQYTFLFGLSPLESSTGLCKVALQA